MQRTFWFLTETWRFGEVGTGVDMIVLVGGPATRGMSLCPWREPRHQLAGLSRYGSGIDTDQVLWSTRRRDSGDSERIAWGSRATDMGLL